MNKIHITKPSISQLEIDYVIDAVKYGWGEKCYDYIIKFENSFAKYQKSKFALRPYAHTSSALPL